MPGAGDVAGDGTVMALPTQRSCSQGKRDPGVSSGVSVARTALQFILGVWEGCSGEQMFEQRSEGGVGACRALGKGHPGEGAVSAKAQRWELLCCVQGSGKLCLSEQQWRRVLEGE